MKLRVLIIFIVCSFLYRPLHAQKVDSIFFHLYTDSLKKGTYNYINVDGKLSNGRWQPLTSKEVSFSCSSGSFDGNSLFLDSAIKEDKIIVTAILKQDTAIRKTTAIYIKTAEPTEQLKTVNEVMQGQSAPAGRRKRNQ